MVNTVSYTCKMANNSFPGHIKTAVTDSAGHCGTQSQEIRTIRARPIPMQTVVKADAFRVWAGPGKLSAPTLTQLTRKKKAKSRVSWWIVSSCSDSSNCRIFIRGCPVSAHLSCLTWVETKFSKFLKLS